jgi:hypothetical protein
LFFNLKNLSAKFFIITHPPIITNLSKTSYITQAPHLIEGVDNTNVIADKGYDSKVFIEQIEKQHCTPVIPPRFNRKDPREYDPPSL